jgi:hypothetical protein
VIAGLGASPGQWPQSLALGYEDQIAVMRTEIEGYHLAPDGNYDALIDVRRKANDQRPVSSAALTIATIERKAALPANHRPKGPARCCIARLDPSALGFGI